MDPVLGRFTQADTIIPNPGNPLAMDRYAYVYNNPVKYIDPTGHWMSKNPTIRGASGTYMSGRYVADGKNNNTITRDTVHIFLQLLEMLD